MWKKLVQLCNITELANAIANAINNIPLKNIGIENCDGTISSKQVNEINGSYIINPDHYHVQKIFDVSTANITGQIIVTLSGAPINTIQFTFGSIAISGDTILSYFTDFGTGGTDIGTSPSFNYNNQDAINSPTRYEAKIYAITSSGNIILLAGIELNWNGTILSIASALPINVSRNYKVLNGTAFQQFCKGNLLSTPFNIDGTAYSLIGTREEYAPVIRDERFGISDITTASGQILSAITPAYSSNRTSFPINTTPLAYNVPAILNSREITIQNLTGSDVTITTSQGIQIVGAMNPIGLHNPNNKIESQTPFTGNINVSFANSVGGNVSGFPPRLIINQKAY